MRSGPSTSITEFDAVAVPEPAVVSVVRLIASAKPMNWATVCPADSTRSNLIPPAASVPSALASAAVVTVVRTVPMPSSVSWVPVMVPRVGTFTPTAAARLVSACTV